MLTSLLPLETMEVDTSLPATGCKRPNIYVDTYVYSSDEQEDKGDLRAAKRLRAGLSPTFATLSLSSNDKPSPSPPSTRKHRLQDTDDMPMDDDENYPLIYEDPEDPAIDHKAKPLPERRLMTPPRKRRPGVTDFPKEHTVYISSIDGELTDEEADAGPAIEVLDPSFNRIIQNFGISSTESDKSKIPLPLMRSLDPPSSSVTERALVLHRPMQLLLPPPDSTSKSSKDAVLSKETKKHEDEDFAEDSMTVDP